MQEELPWRSCCGIRLLQWLYGWSRLLILEVAAYAAPALRGLQAIQDLSADDGESSMSAQAFRQRLRRDRDQRLIRARGPRVVGRGNAKPLARLIVGIDPKRPVALADGHPGLRGSDVRQRLNPMIAIASNAVETHDCDYVVIDGYEPSPPVPLG